MNRRLGARSGVAARVAFAGTGVAMASSVVGMTGYVGDVGPYRRR
jgi:hypothetical protein